MDVTTDTVSFLYGAAVVLAISFISLLLSAAVDRIVFNAMGKKDVD